MVPEHVSATDKCELRPVIGLRRGLPVADLETLTIDAIRTHRRLVEKADQLFHALQVMGGTEHCRYIEAAIEMHAQMSVVNTLIDFADGQPLTAPGKTMS